MEHEHMNNQFEAYSLSQRKKVKFTVEKKTVSNIRGHLTYNLMGTSQNGKNVSTLVNKDQWDVFDVPVEKREVNKKVNRLKTRRKRLNAQIPQKERYVPKSKRKVYNEEIEKWIIEHYGLNADDIKNEEEEI